MVFYHRFSLEAGTPIVEQEYSTATLWDICNAILITSTSLPVQPEYYPIHSADGDLVHTHMRAAVTTST